MNALAWLLTYSLPIALIAFGTVTQGDDDAWRASLFIFAPIAAFGCVVLSIRRRNVRCFRWMGTFHLVTILLAISILPAYWTRVTIARDHIGAGFNSDYVQSFEPESWHFWWAPVMTALTLWVAFLAVLAFLTKQAEQDAAGQSASRTVVKF